MTHFNQLNFLVYVSTEDNITALGKREDAVIDCEEPEMDSIEKIKVDLPKNIIEIKDDLTFIQPDARGM